VTKYNSLNPAFVPPPPRLGLLVEAAGEGERCIQATDEVGPSFKDHPLHPAARVDG
jgi:hypothetical protein